MMRRYVKISRGKRHINTQTISALLYGVWGMELGSAVCRQTAKAYLAHCENLLVLVNDGQIRFNDVSHVVELVRTVKSLQQRPIQCLVDRLKAAPQPWILGTNGDDNARKTLEFAIRLWLMVKPERSQLSIASLTLTNIVSKSFDRSVGPIVSPKDVTLSIDFSARNLIRKGGLRITWTSFLNEHLLLDREDTVRVFHHAAMLRQYNTSAEGCVLFHQRFSVQRLTGLQASSILRDYLVRLKRH